MSVRNVTSVILWNVSLRKFLSWYVIETYVGLNKNGYSIKWRKSECNKSRSVSSAKSLNSQDLSNFLLCHFSAQFSSTELSHCPRWLLKLYSWHLNSRQTGERKGEETCLTNEFSQRCNPFNFSTLCDKCDHRDLPHSSCWLAPCVRFPNYHTTFSNMKFCHLWDALKKSASWS